MSAPRPGVNRRRKHRTPQMSDSALRRQAERDLRAAQRRGITITGRQR